MAKPEVTRRDFLRLSSLAIGGGCLALSAGKATAGMMGGGGGGMGGGGMGGGSTTPIDPPPGAAFREPPTATNLSATPGVVEVRLRASRETVWLDGTAASLLVYNGSYPGPTIRARRGDLLKVHLENALSMEGTNLLGHDRDVTNLHTHGLHVSPSGMADNVMRMAMSGETLDFEYDLSKQAPSTLNFYHPHIHGSVAEQYWNGLVGALAIEDDLPVLSGYETHLVVVKDVTLASGKAEPYTSMMDYMHGKEGTRVMVNGQVNPVLPASPGQVQRWRVLNACNARYLKLSLAGHTLQLVGTEGGLLDRPYPLSSVVVAPGERVDLLVKASATKGDYKLLSLAYDRGGGSSGQQVTLLTMRCSGKAASQPLPAAIDVAAVRVNPPVTATRRLVLSMGQGRGYINGVSFTSMDSATTVHSELGTWEVWEIVNSSGMDHPFHQHVNAGQVLSVTGGDAASTALYASRPAWKDVVNIPRMGSAKILVPVMDYDGMAMFHCHIVEHEDIGMMGVWHIMAPGMPM